MDEFTKSELIRLKQSVMAMREWIIPNLDAIEQSIDELLPANPMKPGGYPRNAREWLKDIKRTKNMNNKKGCKSRK